MKKTRRTMQIGDQIRAEMATIIQRDISDKDIKFVTITEVEVSTDMQLAKVFVSVFGSPEEQKLTMKALERNKNRVRFLIGQRLKLRVTPEISFVHDTTALQAAKIGRILNKVGKETPEEVAHDDDSNDDNDGNSAAD